MRKSPGLLKVYIAGPLSKGNPFVNVRAAVDCWWRLMATGKLAPFCPHLSALLEMVGPSEGRRDLKHEAWIEYDLHWLECCDAVLRLPGPSEGADKEVIYARGAGIPVYTDEDEMLKSLERGERFCAKAAGGGK